MRAFVQCGNPKWLRVGDAARVGRFARGGGWCACERRGSAVMRLAGGTRAETAGCVVAAAAVAMIAVTGLTPVFGESISAERCVSGVGPGCEAAAEESPLVRQLLEKSRANKEKNEKSTLEEYWKRGYGTYFSFGYNKELVQDDQGKWSLQDPDDMRSRIERKIAEQIRARLKKE